MTSGFFSRTGRRTGQALATLVLAALITTLVPAPGILADEIVDHPDKLTYPELSYTPPKPADYRHTLDCGATAFIAEI